MNSDTHQPPAVDPARPPRRSALQRAWMATPDWVFRVLGASVFFGFIALNIPAYRSGIWQHGTFYRFEGGYELWIPWRVLVDLTYLIIALAFCFRTRPLWRAATAREVLLPLIAAFWPLLPFFMGAALHRIDTDWTARFEAFMWDRQKWQHPIFLVGSMLIVIGNLMDIAGYATLFRSISIAAEARELKTSGLYRIVRHPIYLGQILAQGGIWLFYARTHLAWIAFYAAFVAMQLYRSRVEDRVLERAFGEQYLAWKRKTFWFV